MYYPLFCGRPLKLECVIEKVVNLINNEFYILQLFIIPLFPLRLHEFQPEFECFRESLPLNLVESAPDLNHLFTTCYHMVSRVCKNMPNTVSIPGMKSLMCLSFFYSQIWNLGNLTTLFGVNPLKW